MEENKKILLPIKRYKNAQEQELDVKLQLETSESLMRIGDRDVVLDIADLFNKERQVSKKYKIYGKMKMVFRNLYSGSTDYTYLKDRLYLNGDGTDNNHDGFMPYDEFAFLRRDVYREINVPNTGSTLDKFSINITTTGPTGHTIVTPIQAPYQNWNLYLSYVYSGNSDFNMTYTLSGSPKTEGENIIHFKSGDGIPFRLTYTGGSYYEFTSPVEHGMSDSEFVTFKGTTLFGDVKTRTFLINSVGNETYNSEKYVININKSQVLAGLTFSKVLTGKRVLDINDITGTTSNYYVHVHKTLTDESGYVMDKIGFESPIWEDEKKLVFENFSGENDVLVERNRMESVLYDFNEPLVLTGITNNHGFTPTEVYVSTIFRNGEGYFNYPPKVGYKFNFHNTWIDEHFSGSTTQELSLTGTTFTSNQTGVGYDGFTFYSGATLPIGSLLYGSFVEYNESELKERIISDSFHKITIPTNIFNHSQTDDTVFSGSSVNNPSGIYYKTHHKVKLRELSPYIESSKTNDIYNLPENVTYDEKEKIWKWRDLYEHGYIDSDGVGTNFPFINNMHYVKNDINFYLRNEQFYNNKQDGLTDFNNREITC